MPRPLEPPIPATHPERDALLDSLAIGGEAPDTPYLVYADWQEEHGQAEHAELIRLMCELKRTRTRAQKAERTRLLTRMRELFKTPPLKVLRELQSNLWNYDRGFPRFVWLRLAGEIPSAMQRHRWVFGPGRLDVPAYVPFDKVAEVTLQLKQIDSPDLLAEVAGEAWLRRVTELIVTECQFGRGALKSLAASPHLGRVRSIRFERGSVDADEFTALVLARSAVRLEEVALGTMGSNCRVTSPATGRPSAAALTAALVRLGKAPRATQLRSLSLYSDQRTDDAVRALLNAPRLTGLQALNVSTYRLGQRVAAALQERFGGDEDF